MTKKLTLQQRTANKIEATICGIPCLVEVDTFNVVKGNCCADNPDDYYGYTEIEFTVYDRKGYIAKWLEKKMTREDISNINEIILAVCSYNEDDYPDY